MTTIEKIRADIKNCISAIYETAHDLRMQKLSERMQGELNAYEDVLSFLDTLEELVCEELGKEAVSYCFDNGLNLSPRVATDFARHFANWQKEQMMKEAVECETVCVKDRLLAVLPVKEFQWTIGDKVRIIILPKED